MTSIPSFLTDLIVVVGLLAMGSAGMLLAYRIGHPAWRDRFDVRFMVDDKVLRRPGQWGEGAIILLGAAVATLIDALTADASIVEILCGGVEWTVAIAAGILVGTALYGQLMSRPQKWKEGEPPVNYSRLRRGYIPYTLYSSANVAFLALSIALIWTQLEADAVRFGLQKNEVDELIIRSKEMGMADPEAVQSRVEYIHGSFVIGTSYAIDLVNTILLILISALTINFSLNFTALRTVYRPATIHVFNIAVGITAGLVLVLSWFTYIKGYLLLVDSVEAAVSQLRPAMMAAPWSVSQRFHEIQREIMQRHGFLGFLLAVVKERGAFLLVLAAMHFALSARRELIEARILVPPRQN